jgi:drug/metabolite transporter (DMT)-like permease
MRAFDIGGIALALVLVPLVAWASGRVMGRRNWPIGAVLGVAGLFCLGLQCAIITGRAVMEWTVATLPLEALIERRGAETLSNPEFSIFLLVFAAFVTMLGWSATPIDASLRETGETGGAT